MMYAKNDFHIVFYDASNRRVDETKQFVDYNTSAAVTDISNLKSTQTFSRLDDNNIKWFKFEAEEGDTLTFKTDQACTIQLFSPTGKELYTAMGEKSVILEGCHTWENGTHYVAVHNTTGSRENVTLDFSHMAKYEIVSQDVRVVGNGGCSTITIRGNGFKDLYDVELIVNTDDGTNVLHPLDINHISDAEVGLTFDFSHVKLKYHPGVTGSGTADHPLDTPDDSYWESTNVEAVFHFTEKDRTMSNFLRVDEEKPIELTTNVTFPSSYGHVVTYTCKITNKGNMTAYAVPIYIWMKSKQEQGIFDVRIEGLDLPRLSDYVSSEVLTQSEVTQMKTALDALDDDHYFMKYWVEDEDSPADSVCVRSNYFYTNIAPGETKTVRLTISTREVDAFAYFTLPEEWPSYSIESESPKFMAKARFASAKSESWYCCYRDRIECVANIICNGLDIASLFSVPGPTAVNIASCVAGGMNQVLTAAGDTYCGKNDVEGDFVKKVNNVVKGINITAALTSCASAFGVKNASEIVAVLDAFTHPSVTINCITAFFSKKPNCPPTPPGGGGTHGGKSHDPNEIYGYLSQAGSKFLADSVRNVNYRIEFENDTTFATASAHVVEVKDTLDSNYFDLTTFAPTSVKIGDKVEYLDGMPNFVKTVDMRPAINAIVQVEGKYDVQKGIATWTFTSLDPMTMEPTDDVMQGFLPVNYDGESGIGEVTFDVSLKGDFADGTEIPNKASIVFDINDPIMTPLWTNTVDAVAPASQVVGIEQLNDSIVTVHVDGNDERSGIWKYEVYVQYGEEAPWWKTAECTADSAQVNFRFDEGIDYGFCVLSTDSAGNVEKKELLREMSFDTMDENAVRIVVPTITNGSAVYYGQEVGLSCRTEGATIYYTLDGSSPLDEALRMKYENSPIIINDSLTIKTVAVGSNGRVSDMREYRYTVKQTQLHLDLSDGWNWISHNRMEGMNADELKQDYVNRILTQTEEIYNDPILGFTGHVCAIPAFSSFKIENKGRESLPLSGHLFNPLTNPITLYQGWNWLGYPLDRVESVADALSLLGAEDGDCIATLDDGFSQYNNGEWIGNLVNMVPGKGYLYKSMSEKTFAYHVTSTNPAQAPAYSDAMPNQTVVPWIVNTHSYPNMMCVTAELYVNDVKSRDKMYYIGAFVGDECRGIGKYVDGILLMSVYGDNAVPVRFVAVNAENGWVYNIYETIDFKADMIGTVTLPYAFHLGDVTGIIALDSNAMDADGIYNVAGQRMRSLDREGVYIVNGKKVLINKRNMNEYVK